MKTITLTFTLHEPLHLRRYRFFDIGEAHDYLDTARNRYDTRQTALERYIPTTERLEKMLREYGGRFRIGIYVSGIALEMFRSYAPEVVKGLQRIASTGNAELLAGTYSHSLASVAGDEPFCCEVQRHAAMLREHFDSSPETFYNTGLLYSDTAGRAAARCGCKNMMLDGSAHLLGWRSPNYLYANPLEPKLKLLPRNAALCGDLLEMFSGRQASSPNTLARRLGCEQGEILNIVLPMGDICAGGGEYGGYGGAANSGGSGGFSVLEALAALTLGSGEYEFAMPRECSRRVQPAGLLHVPDEAAWSAAGGVSEFLGNELQQEAFAQLYALAPKVLGLAERDYLHVWEFMQCREHFERMAFGTAGISESAACENFINYMNILNDYARELDKHIRHRGTNFERIEQKIIEYEYEFL